MKGSVFTKTIAILIMCLAVLTMICLPVAADLIWEPDDDFYRREAENCESLGRNYTADGSGGSVDLFKSPVSDKKVATVQNGNEFYVSFTYRDRDGEKWGIVQLDSGIAGWIPMNELAIVYDYISFEEEHKSEFRQWEGNYDGFKTGKEVVFWSYPGSGIITRKDSDIDEKFSISNVYTDSDGRDWGFVRYYYGVRNSWVCIDDPANDAIPAFNIQSNTPLPEPGTLPAEATVRAVPKELQRTGGPAAEVLLIVLVSVLVIGTLILLRVFWKKK